MKKCDELLKKAEVFEKLALYGDRKSFLQAIAQPAPFSNPEAPTSFEGDLPSKRKSDPAVKAMQAKLNKLLVPQGHFFPIFEDGIWGDQTVKALQAFKDKYHASATPQAVAQATPQPAKENASGANQVAKTPGTVAPMGSGLSGLVTPEQTKATPGGGSAGVERPVAGPKA